MSEPAPAPKPGAKRLLPLFVLICLVLAGGLWWYKAYGPGAKKDDGKQQRRTPVAVAEAKTRDVEVFLTGLGSVTPLNSVTVKSRVDGQLMQVLFKEGQQVKAGELLLVIDPRPFAVQLAQAEGQLKRDAALLDNARRDLARYQELADQGAIARQQLDTQQALVRQYEGTVASDKAVADSARLQITYCRITSPIAGQVGMRQVDPGNMVRASDQTGLLVVNQLAPITVSFSLPEDQLPRVLAKLREGKTLRVDAYDREQTKLLAQGQLASLDNQIDPSTGTVKLKASFPNTGGELYPNQFVNAKLLLDVLSGAVVIPAAAVQRGQQGAYVYVLTPESTASQRPVSVGEAGDGASVVLQGLAAGEKVVVDGADRLRDGASVELRERGAKGGKPASEAGGQNATAPAPEAKSGQTEARQQAAPQPEQKAEPKPESKPEAKPEAKTDAKAGQQAPQASLFRKPAPEAAAAAGQAGQAASAPQAPQVKTKRPAPKAAAAAQQPESAPRQEQDQAKAEQ